MHTDTLIRNQRFAAGATSEWRMHHYRRTINFVCLPLPV
jgi:hypothetical protein